MSHNLSTPGLTRTWSQTEAAKGASPTGVGLPAEGKICGKRVTRQGAGTSELGSWSAHKL